MVGQVIATPQQKQKSPGDPNGEPFKEKPMDYYPTTAQRNESIWLYIKENEQKNLETHSQTVGQVIPKQTEESLRTAENSSNKEE